MRRGGATNSNSSSSSGGGSGGGGGGGGGGDSKKKGDKDDSGGGIVQNPRKLFSSALDSIWIELSASDISKGHLVSPPQTSDPLDKTNFRIQNNRREQLLLTAALKRPDKNFASGKGGKGGRGVGGFNEEEEADEGAERERGGARGSIHQLNLSRHNFKSEQDDGAGGEGGAENVEGGGAKRRGSSVIDDGVASAMGDIEDSGSAAGGAKGGAVSSSAEEALFDIHFDDGLGTLTADEYVKIRLMPIIASFTTKAPNMSILTNVVTSVTILLSVTSSVFSAFDLIDFIPIALSFSGAMAAWVHYNQTDFRLSLTNGAITQLYQLLIWWDSLSMIEKRVAQNKEFLVQTTESAVQSQVVGYTAIGAGDDDEKGDEDKK